MAKGTQMRTDKQPLRLTRRGERVKTLLLIGVAALSLLLAGVVEEVPESNPPFGVTGTESESK